jgi:hypothetical protein
MLACDFSLYVNILPYLAKQFGSLTVFLMTCAWQLVLCIKQTSRLSRALQCMVSECFNAAKRLSIKAAEISPKKASYFQGGILIIFKS